MTFDEWLAEGIKQGFCSESVCLMHDFGSRSWFRNEEQFVDFYTKFEEGYDPCLTGVVLQSYAS
jgi:hypothetical protein|tara:strand:+ start:284 stop:475 length:192 start_codon:yes stop_codon:yes gene_type:complete